MLAPMMLLAMSGGVDAGTACAATARDVAAGEHLSADMLDAVACHAEGNERHRLQFDPLTRSMVAKEALAAGTYLGRLLGQPAPMLPKGTKVTLRATSGPAIVERQVTTLQPARSGQRVFVRDEGGNIFAVALLLPDEGSKAR